MDTFQGMLLHASARDGWAYILALAAGFTTSLGPCVTPRYFALLALTSVGSRAAAFVRVASFMLGTAIGFLVIASAGSFIVRVVNASATAYWMMSVVLIGCGLWMLVRGDVHRCSQDLDGAPGAPFLLGLASSAVVSPCCTPVLVALGALVNSTGSVYFLAALVAAFASGHLAPAVIATFCARWIAALANRYAQVVRTVNAALLIALGAYYGLLA